MTLVAISVLLSQIVECNNQTKKGIHEICALLKSQARVYWLANYVNIPQTNQFSGGFLDA